MFEFFDYIVGFIESVARFVFGVISGLITSIQVILTAITLPNYIYGYMTPVLSSAIMLTLALGVVKVITGR